MVGGGRQQDVDFINQLLPDTALPNNILAPFWTDLNPADGGTLNINILTDGIDDWIVVEWTGIPEWSSHGAVAHTMQIWIGLDTDTNPGEDISFAYADAQPGGDGGFGTIGAENKFGNRGAIIRGRRGRISRC